MQNNATRQVRYTKVTGMQGVKRVVHSLGLYAEYFQHRTQRIERRPRDGQNRRAAWSPVYSSRRFTAFDYPSDLEVNMKRSFLLSRRTQLLAATGFILLERAAAHLIGYESPLGAGGEAGLLLLAAVGHCDTLDGPLVSVARKSLDDGNVNHVLPWVPSADEAEIRHAFEHAQAVRTLGPEAKSLADRHFLETLVRIHRAGEGAPFTGLKPAGLDHGPAVSGADRALEAKSFEKAENLAALIADKVRHGLMTRFRKAVDAKDFDVDDVKAGREYVDAYVPYVHYAESVWKAASQDPDADHHEANASSGAHAAHSC